MKDKEATRLRLLAWFAERGKVHETDTGTWVRAYLDDLVDFVYYEMKRSDENGFKRGKRVKK